MLLPVHDHGRTRQKGLIIILLISDAITMLKGATLSDPAVKAPNSFACSL